MTRLPFDPRLAFEIRRIRGGKFGVGVEIREARTRELEGEYRRLKKMQAEERLKVGTMR